MNQCNKTVVIYRTGSIGDTVVAVPAMHAVMRRWPDARRVVITNVPVSASAPPLISVLGRETGFVDGVIEYRVGLWHLLALLPLSVKLRRMNPCALVYLMPQRSRRAAWRDWLFFRLSGIRDIQAFPATEDLRSCRVDPRSGFLEREAERLARCASSIWPIDLADRAFWDLRLQPHEVKTAEVETAALSGVPFVAVNAGGKVAVNDWGEANWKALLERLGRSHPGHGLLAVGGEEDRARARELASVWSGISVNACGRLSPRESAAAMAAAELFIGHDSGPLHLADAAGAPCIGLFGDHNRPAKWHPMGSRAVAIHNMAGVTQISVDEVFRAATDSLADRQRHGS